MSMIGPAIVGDIMSKGLRGLMDMVPASNGVRDPTLSSYGQERTGKKVANFGIDMVSSLAPLLMLI